MIFLLLLISIDAWACKAAPLPSCPKPEILLRIPVHKKLQESVTKFQTALTKSLKKSNESSKEKRGFCFNSPFAKFYLESVKEFGKGRGNMICSSHLDLIDAEVKHLIDPSSVEWKAVRSEEDQQLLKKLALDVNKALDEFQGEHSK
jgi:hypothetical protein